MSKGRDRWKCAKCDGPVSGKPRLRANRVQREDGGWDHDMCAGFADARKELNVEKGRQHRAASRGATILREDRWGEL